MVDVDLTFSVTLPAGTPFAGTYELRFGDCTGRDDLDVRRETGMTLMGLLQEAQKDPGLVLTFVCTVAWLVRRKNYAGLQFEQVLNSVPWGSDFDFSLPDSPDDEGKGQGTVPDTPTS